MNQLIASEEQTYDVGETTLVAWVGRADLTYNEWERIGRTFQQLGRSLNFWVGDWLKRGEDKWGEMYAQALEVTGLPQETLSKFKSVAIRVPPEIRQASLSWTHHFAVSYAEARFRGPILELAAHYGAEVISSRTLKEMMRLSPRQMEQVIETWQDDPQMPYTAFAQMLNSVRLDVPQHGIVNAYATHLDNNVDTNLDNLDDELAEEGESYGEAAEEPVAETRLAPAPRPNVILRGLNINEVFDFFEGEGVACTHCLPDEVGWPGMIMRATLDARGRAVLSWERTNARDHSR